MSTSAPSSSKSSPNKPNFNHRTIGLAISSVSVLALGFAIFQIYNIFQEALDVKIPEDATYSNFFDKQTIDQLRHINQHKSEISLPEGRINPFK